VGPTGSVVTIGAYDGVHRGHQAVLAEVARLARESDRTAVLVTFDRHPASVVRPASAPRLLTDLDQRLGLVADSGCIDATVVLAFDQARAREEPEEFVASVLVRALRVRTVVVGAGFGFGHRRRGDVDLLRRLGFDHGFSVIGLDLVSDADPVGSGVGWSSTAIRAALARGDVDGAAAALGRRYEVRGSVVAGDRRGRELGFPTANVAVPSEIALPDNGIYAGWHIRPGGRRHATALSLGMRPTFYPEGGPVLLESHLIDFDGDLYGEAARVQFVARLRGEERFDGVEALVAAMRADVDQARSLLVF